MDGETGREGGRGDGAAGWGGSGCGSDPKCQMSQRHSGMSLPLAYYGSAWSATESWKIYNDNHQRSNKHLQRHGVKAPSALSRR